MIFRTFVDASGSQNDQPGRLMSVAAVVAPEIEWRRVEPKWDAALAKAGVDSLHMAKLGSMDPEARATMLASLAGTLAEHKVVGAALSLRLDDWRALDEEYDVRENMGGPYGFMVATVLKKAKQLIRTECDGPTLTVPMIEAGDHGTGDFLKLKALNPDLANAVLLPKKMTASDGTVRFVRPFEAADLYAYEWHQHVKRCGEQIQTAPDGTAIKPRKSFQALLPQIFDKSAQAEFRDAWALLFRHLTKDELRTGFLGAGARRRDDSVQ